MRDELGIGEEPEDGVALKLGSGAGAKAGGGFDAAGYLSWVVSGFNGDEHEGQAMAEWWKDA